MDSQRVEIPGSELKPRNEERALSAADPSTPVTVSVMLRRNPQGGGPSEEDLLSGKYKVDRESAAAALQADPEDIAAIRSFASQYGLKIVEENAASRTVQLQGSVAEMEKAFGVQLHQSETASKHPYLSYSGAISVPKELGGIVTAVLGLDQRPVARPRSQ